MLKRFKTSAEKREQDIFALMIHNLFDEYRFFHKYPEKELRITGILFGTLIQHQLVSSITLGIALRYVLEALRKTPGQGGNGKMFRFGMFALEQFKSRLHEWPQYCSHIVQIPHLQKGQKELVEEIEKSVKIDASSEVSKNESSDPSANASMDLPSKTGGGAEITPKSSFQIAATAKAKAETGTGTGTPQQSPPPGQQPTSSRVAVFGVNLGAAVDGTGMEKEHPPPADAILDRVQFIINNVSLNNIDAKVTELKVSERALMKTSIRATTTKLTLFSFFWFARLARRRRLCPRRTLGGSGITSS